MTDPMTTPSPVDVSPCPFCGREPITTDNGALVFHPLAPCPLSKQHFDARIWSRRASHNTEADALRELREAAFEFQCAIRANASARTVDAADKRLTAALIEYADDIYAALKQEPKDA